MKLARLGDGPEIFHTLQGEGIGVGTPAVFIRTSRCNLHCVWCDTDHTWNFEGTPWPHEKDVIPGYRKHRREDVTWELTPEDAARVILGYRCPHTVITGGEPLLHEEELLEMIRCVRALDPEHFFEVETNGTRMPSDAFAREIGRFNVSPKLANSGMDARLRIVPDVLAGFAAMPQAWFKFVVSSEADVDEVMALVDAHGLPKRRILLMPEGRDVVELDKSAPWLAERCRDLGVRFSDRLHIRLWGDKRGV
ncbi:MAG: 7-carboxy-7-deazaguanine synthase QueE [Luteolibacter sp.]|jgi:7-carboxy-7-deazaguanine synthase